MQSSNKSIKTLNTPRAHQNLANSYTLMQMVTLYSFHIFWIGSYWYY